MANRTSRVNSSAKGIRSGLFWGILLFSAVLLFLFLDWKPLQHDEGVNAVFIENIRADGFYKYDPANYHGPLHHYLMFLFNVIFGPGMWVMRLSAVLFTLASIYLTMRFERYLGRFPAYSAALFTAVSPGMIFYSRYGIHESGLYFFTLLGLYGFFRYIGQKDKISLWILGLSFTGMVLTKETYIITVGCFVLALGLLRVSSWIHPPSRPLVEHSAVRSYRLGDVIRTTAWCTAIIIIFYSGFFLYWKGVSGLVESVLEWVNTGALPTSEQKGHWKSALYWVQLFIRYEWIACLGFFFILPALGPVPAWLRLVLFYGILNFAVYSVIPYKTPWCIMQIIWPFLFTAAGGLSEYAAKGRFQKQAAAAAVLFLSALNLVPTIRLNFIHYAEDAEPYAHVQTYKEVDDVLYEIMRLSEKNPSIKHAEINVLMKSYWPINWHLNSSSNVGYYTDHYPLHMDAGIIFCDAARKPYVEMRLGEPYFVKSFRLNPAQEKTFVYYNQKLFTRYFEEKVPLFTPSLDPRRPDGDAIRVKLFSNLKWDGEPVKTESAEEINFGWSEEKDKPLQAPFSALYEGEIFVPVGGEIIFYLSSDDGSAFYLGDRLVIDLLGEHPEKIESGAVRLESGWHPFTIKYTDIGGVGALRFWWKLPSKEQSWINPENFRQPREES